MPRNSMKQALGASLSAETNAFQARLAKADAHSASQVASNEGEEVASPDESANAAPVAKVVREAFTIPEAEHSQIQSVREAMLQSAVAVSKSEVVRAGLLLLVEADDATRRAAFDRLERVKTGRPKAG